MAVSCDQMIATFLIEMVIIGFLAGNVYKMPF
jgi:hypothetical protein